jgi:molybdopterin-guanine dinucleotide biosynthesis protein A
MSADKINNAGAYILAGGKSSRMGEDKGLMSFRGKILAEYPAQVLSSLFPEIAIVTGNAYYKKLGYETVPDKILNAGPAGGILSALHHTAYRKNFIVACDMPFITRASVQFILDNSHNAEITIPVFNGKMQPMFGVYDSLCSAKWEELVESRIRKLETLVKHFELRLIEVDSYEFFNEKIFANMNTPENINEENRDNKIGN